jgi:hypothetical protein
VWDRIGYCRCCATIGSVVIPILRACSVNLRFAAWCLAAVGIPGVLSAQPDPASLRPVRGHAEERHVIALTFRDWSPATVAGNTVLAGVATGGGGLFAFDATTGRRKWSFIPTFSGGTAHLTSPPAVAGDVVIAPFGAAHAGAFIAVSLTTGKELWRGPAPLLRAEVVVEGGIAYLQVAPGEIQAVDVATGRVQWRLPIATDRVPCGGAPVVRDGTVYLKTNLPVMAPDRRLSTYHVMALDARTGEERWRYRPAAPYVHSGVCVGQLVVTADAVLAYGESHLYEHGPRQRAGALRAHRVPTEGERQSVSGGNAGAHCCGACGGGHECARADRVGPGDGACGVGVAGRVRPEQPFFGDCRGRVVLPGESSGEARA